jgi:hypothetical protein
VRRPATANAYDSAVAERNDSGGALNRNRFDRSAGPPVSSGIALTKHSYKEWHVRMHMLILASTAALELRFRAPVFGARNAGDLCPS